MFDNVISSWGALLRFVVLWLLIFGTLAFFIYYAPDFLDKAILVGQKVRGLFK